MCDFGKLFGNAFSPKGQGGLDAAAQDSLTQAKNSANVALDAQQQAQQEIIAAADTDSEASKKASEARLRSLLGGGGFASTLNAPQAGGGVAYRTLFGS